MAKNIGVAEKARQTVAGTVAELGYSLWDVEYVREGAEQYLRITIDKDGGVDINDCERVHRAIQPMLESLEWDHLEVSSPGAERTLRVPEHFAAVSGERAEIRLFAPDDSGRKSYTGVIVSSDDKGVTVDLGGEKKTFPYSAIGKAKTLFDFENI